MFAAPATAGSPFARARVRALTCTDTPDRVATPPPPTGCWNPAGRQLGIDARTALIHLAAHLPAAVLADLLHLTPGTAVRWVNNAGGDWSRYAAALATETINRPTQ